MYCFVLAIHMCCRRDCLLTCRQKKRDFLHNLQLKIQRLELQNSQMRHTLATRQEEIHAITKGAGNGSFLDSPILCCALLTLHESFGVTRAYATADFRVISPFSPNVDSLPVANHTPVHVVSAHPSSMLRIKISSDNDTPMEDADKIQPLSCETESGMRTAPDSFLDDLRMFDFLFEDTNLDSCDWATKV